MIYKIFDKCVDIFLQILQRTGIIQEQNGTRVSAG